jgi:hypothetical protein
LFIFVLLCFSCMYTHITSVRACPHPPPRPPPRPWSHFLSSRNWKGYCPCYFLQPSSPDARSLDSGKAAKLGTFRLQN